MSKTVIVFQFFIILLIGITADPLIARQNSFVRIQVYSEDDGNPLQGAVLMIYHAESEPDLDYLFVAVSDQDGIAEFRDLPPDSYLLVIRYIGFSTFRELISTESVNRLNKRVYLQSSVDELDNIEIREQRYITTGEVGLRRLPRHKSIEYHLRAQVVIYLHTCKLYPE